MITSARDVELQAEVVPGASQVEFLVDGQVVATRSSPPWAARWTVGLANGGNHRLSVRATGQGASVTSSETELRVVLDAPDLTPPTVSLSGVQAGQDVTSDRFTLTATAADATGVTRVEFYDGELLLFATTSSPFTFTVRQSPSMDGTHRYWARAYDAAWNWRDSDVLEVRTRYSGALQHLTGCDGATRALTTPGVYVLDGDVSASGACFTLSQRTDIVLDGRGHTIRGAPAMLVDGASQDLLVRNVTLTGETRVAGPTLQGCTGPRRIAFEAITKPSGNLEFAGAVCDARVVDLRAPTVSLGFTSAWFAHGPILVANATVNRLGILNPIDATVVRSTLAADSEIFGDVATADRSMVRENRLRSATGRLDTNDVLRIRGLRFSLIEGNDVVSDVAVAAVVVKFYGLRDSVFANNDVRSTTQAALSYGTLELRSACRDNRFLGNVLRASSPTSVGIMAAASNVCCNSNSDFDPTGCKPPRNADGSCSYTTCAAPPYDLLCFDRNNVFRANTILASTGVFHFGDGSNITYRDNLIVASKGVDAVGCNAPIRYERNTIIGSSQALNGGCGVNASDTVFVGAIFGSQFSGDHNLFSAAPPSLANQTSPTVGQPQFVDVSSSDPSLRDYRLRATSPGAGLASSLAGATVDHDGVRRSTLPDPGAFAR